MSFPESTLEGVPAVSSSNVTLGEENSSQGHQAVWEAEIKFNNYPEEADFCSVILDHLPHGTTWEHVRNLPLDDPCMTLGNYPIVETNGKVEFTVASALKKSYFGFPDPSSTKNLIVGYLRYDSEDVAVQVANELEKLTLNARPAEQFTLTPARKPKTLMLANVRVSGTGDQWKGFHRLTLPSPGEADKVKGLSCNCCKQQ